MANLTDRPTRRSLVAGALGGAGGAALPRQAARAGVEVKDDGRVVDIHVEGRPFAVYNYHHDHGAIYRPFFYPVMGPNGRPITQNGEFPGSMRGHYWHRSLFIAHQKVNGISFWEEVSKNCGRMIHMGFDRLSSGTEGLIIERLAWRDLEGADLLEEVRTIRVPAAPAERRRMDIAVKLRARRDALFDKTPYNLLACRVINAMCLTSDKERYARRFGALVDFSPLSEGGRITNSDGKENDACRGERAKWCDFSGPLGDGTWGGVAILDHPDNPRHPTAWHNWNNMTITASFTFHEPFTLKEGEGLLVAYRVLVHAGDAKKADVGAEWKAFAESDARARQTA